MSILRIGFLLAVLLSTQVLVQAAEDTSRIVVTRDVTVVHPSTRQHILLREGDVFELTGELNQTFYSAIVDGDEIPVPRAYVRYAQATVQPVNVQLVQPWFYQWNAVPVATQPFVPAPVIEQAAPVANELGVQWRTGPRGLKITHVIPGSLGQRLGIEAGDSIFSANRERIRNLQDYQRALAAGRGEVKLVIIGADGQRRDVDANNPPPIMRLGLAGTKRADEGYEVSAIASDSIVAGTPSTDYIDVDDIIVEINDQLVFSNTDIRAIEESAEGVFKIRWIDDPSGTPVLKTWTFQ